VSSNLAFLDPALSYDSTTVYLNLTRNDIGFGEIDGSFNQRAAGSGVESLGKGSALWDATVQMDEVSARAAIDQVSGELHASMQTALIEDSRLTRDAAFARLRDASDDSAGWVRLFGSWGDSDGDDNATALNRDTSGVLFGAEAQFSREVRLGIFGGYSRNSFDGNRGEGNSSNVHIGAYAGGQWDALRLRGGAAYGKYDIDTLRLVRIGTLNETPQSDNGGADMTQVFGEIGYRLGADALNLEPFANLAQVRLSTDSFSETGGISALHGDGASTGVAFATLGVHAQSALAVGKGKASLKGTLGWRHGFGDTTPLSTVSFQNGKAFTVAGVPVAENAAVLDLGFDFAVGTDTTLGVSYSGQFGSGVTDNGVRVDFRMKF
jgi:outer membrane autotransporter protein